MRQATISLHPALFEVDEQRWFLPITLCYQIAWSRIIAVSGPNQADHDFDIEPPYVRWCRLPDLDLSDALILDIRGTEVRSQGWRPLLELADRLVAKLPSPNAADHTLRADQFLKAYLDA